MLPPYQIDQFIELVLIRLLGCNRPTAKRRGEFVHDRWMHDVLW
jgi:hypothetical protein